VKGFYPESFDRVLLDPPCSALGLRPKLQVDIVTANDLQRHVNNQRHFVREAVSLLKPGGTMTYSTCTIHASENEGMVRHILDKYPEMKLVNVGIDIGLPALLNVGLKESERGLVRRFDPSDDADSMGFFIAKFVKTGASQPGEIK
jgi:methyltransferase NSUN6